MSPDAIAVSGKGQVVSSQRKPKQTGEGASNLPPVQASGCRGRRNSQQIFGQTRDSTCQKPWPLQLINLRQAGVARPPAHDRARLTAWSWVVVRAPKEGNLWQIYGAFFLCARDLKPVLNHPAFSLFLPLPSSSSSSPSSPVPLCSSLCFTLSPSSESVIRSLISWKSVSPKQAQVDLVCGSISPQVWVQGGCPAQP